MTPTPHQVLAPDGTLADGYEPTLGESALLEAYRLMVFSRVVDDRVISLQRQGRVGTFAPCTGQEATTVGAALALDPARDWFVPQYRELAALVHHGYTLQSFLRYLMGDLAGARVADGVRVLPIQIALAAQLPHAVGLAWAQRLDGDGGVTLVSFGDGASSEGDFHEALNLAGVIAAPVVFLLQNNQWAISTPRRLQSAANCFASRAEGYGFPGHLVDGNDLFAVHAAVSTAVERARRGEGPTLIEADTYRQWAHNTADDHLRYVDRTEHDRRAGLDPLDRFRTWLERTGRLDDALVTLIEAEVGAEIEEAIAIAESMPAPTADALFAHVYVEPPVRLERQRVEWTAGELGR
jgi:pyruvate dehydrogenase E1 component alpha subunit